jgi:recombinational DNA repair ATPase RecF
VLRRLTLEHVGPAERLELDFAERLNVITGDNGLGKSFLLDVAWWVCAHDWPQAPATPSRFIALSDRPGQMAAKQMGGEPSIGAELSKEGPIDTQNESIRYEYNAS